MGIGQRKQVQMVQILVAQDGEGQNVEVEGDKFGVWADVKNPSGFRQYLNGQTNLNRTKDFRIRFRFDKHPGVDWKLRYQGVDWTISRIDPENEKRFYWNITATSKSDV